MPPRPRSALLLSLVLLLTWTAGTARAQRLRAFPEFVVNQEAQWSQMAPSVAATPGGGSVVAWFHQQVLLGGPDVFDLYLRRLGPEGQPLGPDQRLLAVLDHASIQPAVTVGQDGRITVLWSERLHTVSATTYRIAALHLSPEGVPLGPVVTVVAADQQLFEVAATAADEGLWVAWTEVSTMLRVGLLRTARDGTPLAPPVFFGSPALGEGEPALATSRDGRVMLATTRVAPGEPGLEIVGRIVEAGATLPAVELVLTEGAAAARTQPSVAAVGAHHFAVVWAEAEGAVLPRRLWGRYVRSDGTLRHSRFAVSPVLSAVDQFSPRTAGDANGSLLASWDTDGWSAPGLGGGELRYRFFDLEGTALTSTLQLNQFALSREDRPAAASTGAGRFLAVWQSGNEDGCILPCRSDGADGDRAGVAGRRFELGNSALFLQQGRFRVELSWSNRFGASGQGWAEALTGDTGYFHFGNPDNVEVVVKALDGRAVNGHFWIFVAALTNVEYELRVTDTATGDSRLYSNEQGRLASYADTLAFGGEPATAGALPLGRSPVVVAGLADDCAPAALCLNQGRFEVAVRWRDPRSGVSGVGRPVKLTGDTGYFWFFRDANVELTLKVLDGRPVNGHFWVFYGGLSDVEYTIEVLDTETGLTSNYTNLAFHLASVADTEAF